MSAYHFQHVKEEHRAHLEQRRNRLRTLLLEERNRLEMELRELVPDRKTLLGQLRKKREDLRTAKEERRKKVKRDVYAFKRLTCFQLMTAETSAFKPQLAEELLREHWKKNNPELRKVADVSPFLGT